MSFTSLLVANRGEIARRVIRSAHAMGIRCVAVYVDADVGGHGHALSEQCLAGSVVSRRQ